MACTPNEKVSRWLVSARKWGRLTDLPPALILAVIQQESGGNPLASRHEPRYLEQYGSTDKFKSIVERTMLYPQDIATSYGLMQLMVPTAWGYLSSQHKNSDVIEILLDPDLNIRYGAAHLSALFKKHGSIKGAAGRYNAAGADSRYAKNVEALYWRYDKWIGEQNG